MRITAIVATALIRFIRDRFNLFFVFVFPLAIVLLIGVQYGDPPAPRLGVVSSTGPLADELVDRLDDNEQLEVVHHGDRDSLLAAVDDGLDAGLVIPSDLDDQAGSGEPTRIEFISSPLGVGPQLQAIVDDAVARTMALPTAIHAAVERGADAEQAAQVARDQLAITELITVEITTTGDRLFPEDVTGYDIGAASQLVLFMFLTSLTGSAAIIQSRRLGVTTRMLSTPTSLSTVIGGEGVARFAIAVLQGVYIMVATVVLFDVNWGSLVASATIIAAFATVGAAAAMLSGAVFDNDEQASGIAVITGLGLAALGGAMLPVELFSDTMVTIAKVIPHYWALDAFAEVVRHGGSVADIVPQLAILFGFAAAIGTVAVWRLRVTLTG
ncbi:MAG: ABC transporter permease [Acidimicrobiales bacterium]